MISGFVSETGEEYDGNKSVTVTIDDSGKINVDQEVLKSILESNQQSATVTFVRIGEEEQPQTSISEEGDIILDTEEMTRLEKVLRSDEAKDFLSTVLAQTPTLIQDGPLPSVVDMDDGSLETTVVVDVVPPPAALDAVNAVNALEPFKKEETKMTRRSQRQMDKEMKEEAERIRLENQAQMRKEMEAASSSSSSSSSTSSTSTSSSKPVHPTPEATTNSGRPKRERKVPAHLMTGDYESSLLPTSLSVSSHHEPPKVKRNMSAGKVGPPVEEEEEEEEEDSGDWNSEDDPERLWCICNEPHNNRFMICCDSCLDWFHGKCVGITKKMGKDMEEASQVWKCPKCSSGSSSNDNKPPSPKAAVTTQNKKQVVKVKKEELKKKTIPEPEKKKERSCYVCDKPPRLNSIFCSDDCISKHANKAKALLQKSRPKASDVSASSGKTQVLVIEPNTNTMLNGPNAPTEGTLEVWLKSHPTFHVVMPTSLPTSKFYGNSTVKKAPPKVISPHHKTIQISPDGSRVHSNNLKKSSPSQSISSEEMREAEIKKVQKSLHQHILKEAMSKKSQHHPQKTISSNKIRTKSPPPRKSASSPPPNAPSIDPKPIRANAVKGFYDALKSRLAKVDDVQITDDDLKSLVEEIEESLFRYYNKDVTSKYKAKYRSLVFNIKDEKNTGFFRKVVSRKISTKDLVSLTAEEMANKELQRWREKELKNDIEKIKSHELDMIKLGAKFVMKSHKGEIAIEGEETATSLSTPGTAANPPLKLPEEINEPDIIQSSRKKDVIEGARTWDHGTHGFEPTCDVCNGKKTLEEFLTIKISKEQKESKQRDLDKKKSSSSKYSKSSSHHSRDKERNRKRSRSKESDRKHSSSKHKDRRRSKSRDKDSKRSSKDENRKEDSGKSSHSHRHSSRDDSKSSSRHKSSSKSSSHKSKTSHESSSKSSQDKSKAPSSSHSSIDDSNKVTKSLEEIWSSKRKEHQDLPQIEPIIPPDSSETNKKIEEAQKTIANVINSSIPEVNSKSSANISETNDKNNEVVSSTVTIKTPESVSVETNPIVWKGDLNMPDVAKFSVTAHQVSGTTDYLTVDLKPLLKIVGRIDPASVWEYIAKMKESPNKEVLLVRLEPTSEDEKTPYMSFFNYLQNRNRFGVVGDSTGKMVKDCYILPLGATQTVHNCMLPYEGPGLEFLKSDMLLALIVRGKRKRALDYQPSQSTSQSYNNQHKNKVQIFEGGSAQYPGTSAGVHSRKRDLETRYDPIYPIKSKRSEDSDVYDPEVAFLDEANNSSKRLKTDANNPKFSDEEDGDNLNEPRPITSTGGGFTEKLAQLTAEIEMQKKEINSIENCINNQNADTNRDPRNKPAAPSRLSNMTDEDLMAKAQEMLDLQNASSSHQSTNEDGTHHSHVSNPPFISPQIMTGLQANAWANTTPWGANQGDGPWAQPNSNYQQQNPWKTNNSQFNNNRNSSWYEDNRDGGVWSSHRHSNGKKRSGSPTRNFSQDYKSYKR